MKKAALEERGPNHAPDITRAHDVRYLAQCGHCKELMDSREAIKLLWPQSKCEGSRVMDIHPTCVAALMARKEWLALPDKDLNKFCLADVGVEGMKAILREMDKRKGKKS